MHHYQIRLYNTDGVQTAVFDDWNSLYYFNRLNDYGYHTLSIAGDTSKRGLFETDCFVEVLRAKPDAGVEWYTDYIGFHRTDQDQVTDRGAVLFTSYGRSLEDLIHRRSILYTAGTGFDTKAGHADDVAKQYVRENAGSLATTANGRLRDGVTTGLVVDNDTGEAGNWEGSAAYRNLLETIQNISDATPFDFAVIRDGPLSFRFKTYYPRKGADRTGAGAASPHVFSLGHANMGAPYATTSHVEEVTSIIVLGPGEGANRTIVIRDDVDAQQTSPWNLVERTHDARNVSTTAGLEDAGDAQLRERSATRHISFQVLESEGSVYGRDYFIGDLVKCDFAGLVENKKITGVEITVAEGREDIRIHFDNEGVNT